MLPELTRTVRGSSPFAQRHGCTLTELICIAVQNGLNEMERGTQFKECGISGCTLTMNASDLTGAGGSRHQMQGRKLVDTLISIAAWTLIIITVAVTAAMDPLEEED